LPDSNVAAAMMATEINAKINAYSTSV